MSEHEMDRRRRNAIGTEPTVPGPGHGQQNAVAERAIGLVRKLSNKLIHSPVHNMPEKMASRLWPYADNHAAKLMTLMPTSHNTDMAPPAEKRYNEEKGALKKSYLSRLRGGKRALVDKLLFPIQFVYSLLFLFCLSKVNIGNTII